MLTAMTSEDDRTRASKGLVVSLGEDETGQLKITLDSVVAETPGALTTWKFRCFQGHYAVDRRALENVERELAKPLDEMHIDLSDDALRIGHALLSHLISLHIQARRSG